MGLNGSCGSSQRRPCLFVSFLCALKRRITLGIGKFNSSLRYSTLYETSFTHME